MDPNGNIKPPMDSVTSPAHHVVIQRQMYTQCEFDEIYADQTPSKSVCEVIRDNYCQCSARCVGRQALSYIPVIKFIRKYKWREWTVLDLVAGLSGGFIHLPQGLGFGILASLTPAVGLYSSFFPTVVYLIFGTSPFVSMGTNAVIAILTSNVVLREANNYQQSLGPNITLTGDELMNYKIGISVATCFVGGLILLAMGLFRLGFITNFLSKSFIGGFTFAAAVHIATSQIVKMLKVKVPNRSGMGNIVMTYIDIFSNITTTNPADLIIGLICMAILLAVKIGINEKFAHKMKVPIPIELLLVILSTIVSHFAGLKEKYDIAIVGPVPEGMPAPSLPPMDVLPRVATDGFVIAILSFALTISVGKLCDKIHGTEMDDNQELVSYGLCYLVGAFFQNFPPCIAPPRTMLLSSMGSKSTLNGVTSAIFVLLILLVAGSLFVSLPVAMLAAMIIVSMKELLMQIRQLPSLWRVNKPDFFIWMVTGLVSVFADLDLGLAVGVVFSMITVLAVSQLAKGRLLGTAESEDVVTDTCCKGIRTVPGVRIFRFESQLYFASQERFKRQLYALVFNPTKVKVREIKVDPNTPNPSNNNEEKITHLILDCSVLGYIDVAGVDMLKTVMTQFSRAGVDVYLAALPTVTLETLRKAQFFDARGKEVVFYSVFDALMKVNESRTIVTAF